MIKSSPEIKRETEYTYRYPRPAVTVDVVLFAYTHEQLKTLLIRRAHEPYEGAWALPGGFVEMDEDLSTAAQRELAQETNLRNVPVQQLHTYGAVDRDPRGRVISVAHWAVLSQEQVAISTVRVGSDAAEVAWTDVRDLPEMAFDHTQIVAHALARLRTETCERASGLRLLSEEFTLTEAQSLYEAVLGVNMDKRNFRRQLLAAGILRETEHMRTGSHRPAKLYRLVKEMENIALASRRFPC